MLRRALGCKRAVRRTGQSRFFALTGLRSKPSSQMRYPSQSGASPRPDSRASETSNQSIGLTLWTTLTKCQRFCQCLRTFSTSSFFALNVVAKRLCATSRDRFTRPNLASRCSFCFAQPFAPRWREQCRSSCIAWRSNPPWRAAPMRINHPRSPHERLAGRNEGESPARIPTTGAAGVKLPHLPPCHR